MLDAVRNSWRRLRHVFIVKFALTVFERFGRDNGALLAAGLAFFLVLAFVPMLLTGVAAVGFYFHLTHRTGDAVAQIRDLLTTQILPGAAGNEVQHLMERANVPDKIKQITAARGIAGVVGMLGLVWTSIQIYLNGAVAMNAAWQVTETRSWIRLRLVALGLFLVTGVFLVLSLASTAYGTWLTHSSAFGSLPGIDVVVEILTEAAAVVGAAVMFGLTYKYLPAAKVTWKAAFVGGVTAACLWEIAKKGLAVYLLHPNVSLYGNLANLMIFIAWVYYSMTILLMGAHVSGVYKTEVEGRRRSKMIAATPLDAAADWGIPTVRSGRKHSRRRQLHQG